MPNLSVFKYLVGSYESVCIYNRHLAIIKAHHKPVCLHELENTSIQIYEARKPCQAHTHTCCGTYGVAR